MAGDGEQASRFQRFRASLADGWVRHRPAMHRYAIYAMLIAGVAILCAVFPPAGFMGLSTFAWQCMIPMTIGSLCATLEQRADMEGKEPYLLLVATMLLSAAFMALFTPTMPAALLLAMSVSAWKVMAICFATMAPLGYALIFLAMSLRSPGDDWSGAFRYWGLMLFGTFLTMPLMMVMMPGSMLAFASSVAPSAGSAAMMYSAMGVSNLALHGIMAGTAIVFGIVAAVQTVGVLMAQASSVISKTYPVTRRFLAAAGDAVVWLALLIPVVLGATMSAVGNVALQGADLARRGLMGLAPPFNIPNPFDLMQQASNTLALAGEMLPSAASIYHGVTGVIIAAGTLVWGSWRALKDPDIDGGDASVGGVGVPKLKEWHGKPVFDAADLIARGNARSASVIDPVRGSINSEYT